jgi:hypothetical protein
MFPEKNGVNYVEHGGSPGDEYYYKIWEADQWACKECGISVLIGFGKEAYAEHRQEPFLRILARVITDPWTVVEKKRAERERKEAPG